jgi:hypothetical protein
MVHEVTGGDQQGGRAGGYRCAGRRDGDHLAGRAIVIAHGPHGTDRHLTLPGAELGFPAAGQSSAPARAAGIPRALFVYLHLGYCVGTQTETSAAPRTAA